MYLVSIYGEVIPVGQIGFISFSPIDCKGFMSYMMCKGYEAPKESYDNSMIYVKCFNGEYYIFNLRKDGNCDRILGFSTYSIDSDTLRNIVVKKWERELKDSGRSILTIGDIKKGEDNGYFFGY